MDTITVKVRRLPTAEGLPLPRYMTEGAAGMDLVAAVEQDVVLRPGERKLIPTGIQVALPAGYEGQVRPRSGLAVKYGVSLLNTPGTIDADYRGEIKVLMINFGQEPFVVRRGDRIAQLVLSPVVRGNLVVETQLDETTRGGGGFGHTG
ncbi:MAG TPA: dUTP diphosphatase, partial [Firmicutes bacterium]|nr:dUTP diphosphatase [Bacillota bacterium]